MGQGAHINRFWLMSNSMRSLGHVRMVSFFLQLPIAIHNLSISITMKRLRTAPEWLAEAAPAAKPASTATGKRKKRKADALQARYQPRQSHQTHHPVAEHGSACMPRRVSEVVEGCFESERQ